MTRLGELLAILCAIVAAFQLRRCAATRPTDASTGASLLAFHIAELQRRRDLLRSVWRWIVVPIVISIWVILAGFVQARPGSAGTLLTFACIMTVIGLVLSSPTYEGPAGCSAIWMRWSRLAPRRPAPVRAVRPLPPNELAIAGIDRRR